MFYWSRLLRDYRFIVACSVVYRHENHVRMTTDLRELFERSLWYYVFAYDRLGISNSFPNEFHSLKNTKQNKRLFNNKNTQPCFFPFSLGFFRLVGVSALTPPGVLPTRPYSLFWSKCLLVILEVLPQYCLLTSFQGFRKAWCSVLFSITGIQKGNFSVKIVYERVRG